MIGHIVRRCLLAGLALSLAGCVGFHSLPPADYAGAPDDGVLRLVFDERGNPWPLYADAGVRAVLPPPGGLDRSRSFRLGRKLQAAGDVYDREAVLDEAVARLTGPGNRPARRVVVLINGFNNSYGSFHKKYAATREWLVEQGASPDVRFVEVYWDALHRAGGKVAYPALLFPRSRGNAARAGACGLRDLLRRLPAGTEVSLVAHSLGSQVALSAVSEPPPGRKGVDCDGGGEPVPLPAQLGDLRLALFAPALGAQQLQDPAGRISATLLAGLSRLVIAWDPNDRVITKRNFGINLPDTWGGDTRLGGNARFVAAIMQKLAAGTRSDRVSTVQFSQPSHELSAYLADRDRAVCILWAARVLPVRPDGCALAQ